MMWQFYNFTSTSIFNSGYFLLVQFYYSKETEIFICLFIYCSIKIKLKQMDTYFFYLMWDSFFLAINARHNFLKGWRSLLAFKKLAKLKVDYSWSAGRTNGRTLGQWSSSRRCALKRITPPRSLVEKKKKKPFLGQILWRVFFDRHVSVCLYVWACVCVCFCLHMCNGPVWCGGSGTFQRQGCDENSSEQQGKGGRFTARRGGV